MPITVLTAPARDDIADARNLITRLADDLPLKLAEKACAAAGLLDDIENALADGGCEL
jgi:hypothetical protein